jgi:hypothetical protein
MRPMRLALASLLIATAAAAEPADLVVENARLWSDGLAGFAEFAAVRSGRFVHVGARDESLIGPATQRVDAAGRVVVPGLIDAHIHMLNGGFQESRLRLRDAASREEFAARVAEWAQALPPGAWILGGRWSTEGWADPSPPVKEWIDAASAGHPLYLPRMDGHSALVNSTALHRAGITASGPPDPPGGVIDRDASGAPTGILRESAMALVSRHIPPPTDEEKLAALAVAAKVALRSGITAVGDIASIDDAAAYQRLANAGPGLRHYVYLTAADWQAGAAVFHRFRPRAGWVELRGFKTYIDGSLGSRTAYMHEPYLANEPGRGTWRGLLRESAEGDLLRCNLESARDLGVQAIAHAIGDEANHLLLDTLESVYGARLSPARPRSEHAQHLLPEDIERFGRLGVIASMQPYHKADDGRYAESYIGPERSRSSYAFRSLLDAGAVVAFGSDWPVVTLDPFKGIQAAVTGKTLDGKAWQPQETISADEALRCYTSRAAYALFAESELGRIAPDYRADFVILSASPFDPLVRWDALRPAAVFIEGRQAYP